MDGLRRPGPSCAVRGQSHLEGTRVGDAGLDRLVDEDHPADNFGILNLVNTRTTPEGIRRFLSKAKQPEIINRDGKLGKGVIFTIF